MKSMTETKKNGRNPFTLTRLTEGAVSVEERAFFVSKARDAKRKREIKKLNAKYYIYYIYKYYK